MGVPQKVKATIKGDTNRPDGLLVSSCRYDYEDIIEILKDKKYKLLVLQFSIDGIKSKQPLFGILSYPSTGTSSYGIRQELKTMDAFMDISKDDTAIMGNNLVDLNKLRKMLFDSTSGDFFKFSYLKFSPKIQHVYSGHIVYDIEAVPALTGTATTLTTNPCPPSCPISIGG